MNKMRLGYLGPEGTFTEEASQIVVEELNLHPDEAVPLSPIDAVFSRLEGGRIDIAVVPRKNSLVGDYIETVNCLQRYDTRQVHEVRMRIILGIGIHPDSRPEDISEVWSKDTALGECSMYLDEHFLTARRMDVESTAYAMKQISQRELRRVAAIGSLMGLKKYGLKVLDEDIGNDKENYTTFIALERGRGI